MNSHVDPIRRYFGKIWLGKEMTRPTITEDPPAEQRSEQAAKTAAGVKAVPTIPKPAPKVRQSVAEMKEALRENMKAQKMGPAVHSNISDVIEKKGGMLKPHKTKFDKMDKYAKTIEEIVEIDANTRC